MAIRDSLLTSAAEPGPSEQILAESTALACWLSQETIVGFIHFLFTHALEFFLSPLNALVRF